MDLSNDSKQIIYSYLELEEVIRLKDDLGINLQLYFKYTEIEKRITMEWASQDGHLDVVRYLHSIGLRHIGLWHIGLRHIGKECTTWAMDFASNNGHLDVVKYLHGIRKECTTRAMTWQLKKVI